MNGREVLEEALRQCCADYCEEIPCSEEDIDLGEDYEKYMNSLIRRSKKPFRRCFDTAGKRAAGIAAAFLVMIGCTMSVSAVRKPIVGFLTNTYDKYVELFFDENDVEKAPTKIETVYTLGAVPEGYELDSKTITPEYTKFVWKNENGSSIILTQDTLDGMSSIDNENMEQSSFDIDGMQILCIEKLEYKSYYWNTNEYLFYMNILDDDISAESGVDFIRSITEYQK